MVLSLLQSLPAFGTEESYLNRAGRCFFPVIVVINTIEKLGTTIFFLKNEFAGQTHI